MSELLVHQDLNFLTKSNFLVFYHFKQVYRYTNIFEHQHNHYKKSKFFKSVRSKKVMGVHFSKTYNTIKPTPFTNQLLLNDENRYFNNQKI